MYGILQESIKLFKRSRALLQSHYCSRKHTKITIGMKRVYPRSTFAPAACVLSGAQLAVVGVVSGTKKNSLREQFYRLGLGPLLGAWRALELPKVLTQRRGSLFEHPRMLSMLDSSMDGQGFQRPVSSLPW